MATVKKRTKKTTRSKYLDKTNRNIFIRIKQRITKYLDRRPHRSFRRTRRRDYIRPLHLPGYLAFTVYVGKTIWANRKIFILLALIYILMTALLVGVASQDVYSNLLDTLKTTSGNSLSGFWGEIGKSGLLFVTTMTGGLTQNLTDIQQVFAGIITLSMWLTSVWLLRNILAGHKVKLRDGLYNAGAPILSTFIVALLIVIQLLPIALVLIGYGAASTTGLLNNGVEAMLFWVSAGLLVCLSLYLITSTIFALIIVTLPGMYPSKAIRVAGDLVLGRRLKILARFLWMAIGVVLAWALIMIPMIIFDSWIKSIWPTINWLPIIPILLLIVSSLTVIWVSSYIYLLYRKVVDDGSTSN